MRDPDRQGETSSSSNARSAPATKASRPCARHCRARCCACSDANTIVSQHRQRDSLSCQIPLEDKHRVTARVIDISGGGIAVITPPDNTLFQPDMRFQNCQLQLPEFGSVIATVRAYATFSASRNATDRKCCAPAASSRT